MAGILDPFPQSKRGAAFRVVNLTTSDIDLAQPEIRSVEQTRASDLTSDAQALFPQR